MKSIKKGLKYLFWGVLSIIVIANLAVLLSGRLYIYKGFWATYMQGHLQPSIYDDDVFLNRDVKAGTAQPWTLHPQLGKFQPSTEQRQLIESLNPASFLVCWGDTILYEEYWNGHDINRQGNSFSMAKSVVSLLIGAAIEDGYITSIDEPAANYLPELKEGDKAKITIRHFLTMSSGLSWSENYFNPFCDVAELYYDTDARDLTLNRRVVEETPGEIFDYKSGDTQTLMYILKAATGKSVADYASEKIWSKIGAESDAFWSLVGDENSEEKSFCCIYSTTRDFARLGKLINQNGNWKGEQLINEDYVKEFKSLAPLKTKSGKNNRLYAFQYWVYTGMPYEVTYFRGMLGQMIISIPEYDLVIVRTGEGVGPNWKNTPAKIDDDLEGHRTELPEYIQTAMDIFSQAQAN